MAALVELAEVRYEPGEADREGSIRPRAKPIENDITAVHYSDDFAACGLGAGCGFTWCGPKR